MNTDEIRTKLSLIERDMAQDAAEFDGQPFTGKTVGTYFGYHGAAIAALATIIKLLLNEIEILRGGDKK